MKFSQTIYVLLFFSFCQITSIQAVNAPNSILNAEQQYLQEHFGVNNLEDFLLKSPKEITKIKRKNSLKISPKEN